MKEIKIKIDCGELHCDECVAVGGDQCLLLGGQLNFDDNDRLLRLPECHAAEVKA